MKMRLSILAGFFCLLSVATARAQDLRVCMSLTAALNEAQDRYERAELQFYSMDAICADDASPAACKSQVMSEFESAKAGLASAQANFNNAGCTK